MLEDEPELESIVVPIGGGGVISGTAIAAKTLKPEIEMVGVEVKLYPSMYRALRGEPARCGGSTLAEGIAVKNVTERTVAICRNSSTMSGWWMKTEIERAVMAFLTHQKTLAEGAGAAGLAAVAGRSSNGSVGGSTGPRAVRRQHRPANSRLGHHRGIAARDAHRQSRESLIDDRPGVLGKISTLLGQHGANILEVSHRRMFLDIPAKGAELEIMIETRDQHHAEEIVRLIEAQGFITRVLDAPGGRESALIEAGQAQESMLVSHSREKEDVRSLSIERRNFPQFFITAPAPCPYLAGNVGAEGVHASHRPGSCAL